MQDPAREITGVVELLAASVSPDLQESAFQRYVAADATFRHPLCKVETGVRSRDNILAIYQCVFSFFIFLWLLKFMVDVLCRWYRVMSPKIDISVNNIGEQTLSRH